MGLPLGLLRTCLRLLGLPGALGVAWAAGGGCLGLARVVGCLRLFAAAWLPGVFGAVSSCVGSGAVWGCYWDC